MIPEEKYGHAVALLALGGHSQASISEIVGVSRGTVASIANGTYHQGRRNRLLASAMKSGDAKHPSGPFVRCRQCGGMVQMPCLLCKLTDGVTITQGGNTPAVKRKCLHCGRDRPELYEFTEVQGVTVRNSVCSHCKHKLAAQESKRRRHYGRKDRRGND